ncbi:MAG TPA: ATP-binding protein, partial [Candidatus Wallbacteria bacterium]|nr:ATP-binding protein [Candidatus Wallbacteria bacterium]
FETVHKRKDGSLYDVEVHLQLIERENESLFLAVINDITERKKIEKAVLKNEQKYRLLFKNMTSGFALHEIILDDNKKTCDYRFIEVNDSFEALTGAKAADIIGKTVKTIMPATEDYWIETYGKVALTGEAVRFENYSAAIGKFFEILAYSPEPGKFATIFQDITERKAIEKQILELNDCLEKRVAERTAQLEASNKELEAFAYSVSHDLRAPLRAIDGFSRFLAEDYGEKLDAEGNRLIKVVRDNTQKMDQLISDLLSLSRISRSEMSMAKIDMKKMAGLIYEEILTEEKKASYEWNCPQMPQAFGDPNLIRQVWHNLISNAVKYASRSTLKKIEAGGYILDGETVYFIKDTGVGFNPDYVNKLFGVFQRLHKSEEFEGNGVGLAIVQRIIHRHGGRVWAEGKINEGAAFYFTLPVKEN